MYTLAHNRVIDFFRSHSRSEAILFDSDDEADATQSIPGSRVEEPQVQALAREQGAAILRLLDGLPAPQREAFLLHEEAGLSVEEIAAATGVTFEAAKSRLRYAVAKLREGLREYV